MGSVHLLLLLVVMQDPEPLPPAAVEWFPEGLLYRHPLADPREPISGVRFQVPVRAEDDFKIETRLGTHLALWRRGAFDWRDPAEPARHWAFEVQAEGAVFSRFNFDENWDMDAADFRVGVPLVARRGPWAFKVHPWHVTSHLGDEFIERTGRRRITYARNELAAGVSYDFGATWRVALEGGYALSRGNVNEPLRFMASAETVGRHFGPSFPETFAAVNLTSFEEQDWNVQLNVEVGVWLRGADRHRGLRLSIGYFNGPSPLTQFFDDHEQYVTFGFSVPF